MYGKELDFLFTGLRMECISYKFIVCISETSQNSFLCVSVWFPTPVCSQDFFFLFDMCLNQFTQLKWEYFLFTEQIWIFVLPFYVLCTTFIYWKENVKLLPILKKYIGFDQFLYISVYIYIYIRKNLFYIFSLFTWVCFSRSKTDKYKLTIIFINYGESLFALLNLLLMFQLSSEMWRSRFPNDRLSLSEWLLSWGCRHSKMKEKILKIVASKNYIQLLHFQ